MGLTKYKLGELIEIVDLRNKDRDNKYTEKNVKGISTDKKFIATKANLEGVSLNSYRVVDPKSFAYVADTSRRGDKISLAFNITNEVIIVSSISTIFKVKREELLDPNFLFMYFNRTEFDRFSRFNSWGSARETFSWEDFCDIEINLPSIEIQKKYVAIYEAMLKNQEVYEEGLEDLKLTCDATIENIKAKHPKEKIMPYINREDNRNSDNMIKNVKGVSTSKEFREPTSKVNRDKLSNYKIVKPKEISFVQTTHNEKVFAYAFNNTDKDILVTSVNEVFSTSKDLLPEYLVMFFNRKEFDRYARFHSWGSARETFTWEDLENVEIPIISIQLQKYISDIYKVYTERKEINEKLKEQIKSMCPILIKGAMEEARREEV